MTTCRYRLTSVSALLLLASGMLVGQPGPAPCPESGSGLGGQLAALKPPDVLLAITSPRAGERVLEFLPDETVSATVDYWGPRLLSARAARKVDDYHLVFFLDTDAAPYIGTVSPAPRCNPSIVHTDTSRVTFNHVMHGAHTLYVILVGSNDISVNPPVAASTSFVVSNAT